MAGLTGRCLFLGMAFLSDTRTVATRILSGLLSGFSQGLRGFGLGVKGFCKVLRQWLLRLMRATCLGLGFENIHI